MHEQKKGEQVLCTQQAESNGKEQPEQVLTFFKKPTKNKNIRKRRIDQDEDEDNVMKNSNVKFIFSTGPAKQSSSGEPVKESKYSFSQYESSKAIQVHNDSKATAMSETETDFSKDARAIRERALKQAEEAFKGKNNTSGDEKIYKGIHGYTDYKAGFRREQTITSEKAGGSHGPLRASAHIRVSARFDYQPDICKDYKETGYCGYGDSCKFLHDRGDYKSGWQMEKEWDETEKARKRHW